jgi:hypothetical protein
MELPIPTMGEFRRLYAAAIAFKKEAPWEWMYEDQIFGIRNPEMGQIGYASVMGMLGEHLALGLYLGSEGLDGFWRMHREEAMDNSTLLLEIPQLQASFEDRNTLHAKDREVIKALGLKFRGRMAWPMFRSYVPGYMPWFVTPEEARFLVAAMEQTLEVTRRLSEEPTILDAPKRDQYLVRTRTEQGWTDEWLTPPPIPMRPPPMVDSEQLAAMRRELPRQQFTLQADLFALPAHVKEKEDPRPYLLYNLMIVEASSGMILGTDLLAPKPSLDALWAQAPTRFLDAIALMGYLPQRIAVRDERLYSLLLPLAAGLGIRLERSWRLPALDEARTTLETWMA